MVKKKKAKKKSIIRYLNIIIVVAALAVLLVVMQHFGWQKFWQELGRLSWLYVVAAFLLDILAKLLWAYRWDMLLHRKKLDVPYRKTFLIFMAGTFVDTTTPGAYTGGEILKLHYLNRLYPRNKAFFLATMLIDKFLAIAGSQLLFAIALLYALFFSTIPPAFKQMILVAVLLVALLFVGVFAIAKGYLHPNNQKLAGIILALPYIGKRLRKKYTEKKLVIFLKDKFTHFGKMTQLVVKDKSVLWYSGLLASTMSLISFAKVYLIIHGMGFHPNFLLLIIVVVIANIIGHMAFTPGGFGITEASMFGLYQAMGINAAAAGVITMVDRGIYYLTALGGGYAAILYLSLKVDKEKPRLKKWWRS